ncbi:hypothetical protein GCM10022280_10310 [Sphingomonas swuensis]|uniref:Lipoprotein n=1 Tax=Sphingomonas swuensis TaxID=977800 RepID=A0ABP7SMI5_9SPHN
MEDRRRLTAAMVMVLGLAGCSAARIAVPSSLATEAERIAVSGMGGGGGGSFRLADVPGHFTRGAERLGSPATLVSRFSGGGSFELPDSRFGPAMAARCRYGEVQPTVGAISVAPERLRYSCELQSGGRLAGALRLEAAAGPLGSPSGRAERRGTFDYLGQRLEVRSIHRMEGGGLPTPTPLGYMFLVDGREVGAVDLNGTGKTILAPRSGEQRSAVIAAGLALSILWDPADLHSDY